MDMVVAPACLGAFPNSLASSGHNYLPSGLVVSLGNCPALLACCYSACLDAFDLLPLHFEA